MHLLITRSERGDREATRQPYLATFRRIGTTTLDLRPCTAPRPGERDYIRREAEQPDFIDSTPSSALLPRVEPLNCSLYTFISTLHLYPLHSPQHLPLQ